MTKTKAQARKESETYLKNYYNSYGNALILSPAHAKAWGLKESKDKPWILISKPVPKK